MGNQGHHRRGSWMGAHDRLFMPLCDSRREEVAEIQARSRPPLHLSSHWVSWVLATQCCAKVGNPMLVFQHWSNIGNTTLVQCQFTIVITTYISNCLITIVQHWDLML
jgi:hypothetical protein